MNNKGQRSAVLGFVLIVVVLLYMVSVFGLIDALKDTLNDARDTTSLNCLGTSNFNQTAYDEDNTLQKLTRRPTCFVTGMGLVWFVGAFLIAVVIWAVTNWRKL